MEIMTMMNYDELSALQAHFARFSHKGGLGLDEFVAAMMDILKVKDKGQEAEMVAKLCDLFAQVDVNGDGSMEWEEFSAFCISTGIRTTYKNSLEKHYSERTDFKDHFHHGGYISMLRYIPELNLTVSCEGGKVSLKLYEMSFETGKLTLQHETRTTKSYRGNSGAALDAVYVSQYNALLTTNTDMYIRAFDMSLYLSERKRPIATPNLLGKIKTDTQQMLLCWDPASKLLFSSGTDGKILAWEVEISSFNAFKATIKCTFPDSHDDIVKCMLAIPSDNLLVTGGMDGKVLIWDTEELTLKSMRDGHKSGVHSLVDLGDGYLISGAYENDIYCWTIRETSFEPYFILAQAYGGHQFPVYRVVGDCNSAFVFSVDVKGVFKWWDARVDSSIVDTDRCLQTFTVKSLGALGSNQAHFTPSALGLLPCPQAENDGQLEMPWLIGADAKLHLFAPVMKKRIQPTLTSVVYNDTMMAFVAAYGDDVKFWDAASGKVVKHFRNIAPSITKVCLDERERKLYIGTMKGAVTVHNCENGSKMKRAKPFKAEVTGLVNSARDNCFIACSSDRRLRVYDDAPIDKAKLLREVECAHAHDITTMTFSHSLSLIATGDSNGVIRIWDFQFCQLEEPLFCRLPNVEITCLRFADPFAVLLSSDTKGDLWVWKVKPSQSQKPLCRISFQPAMNALLNPVSRKRRNGVKRQKPTSKFLKKASQDMDSQYTQVNSIDVLYDVDGGKEIVNGIFRGRYFLLVGDTNGFVSCIDLSQLAKVLELQPVDPDLLPINQHNYFPRRRVTRNFAQRKFTHPPLPGTMFDNAHKVKAVVLSRWLAHSRGSLTGLACIGSPKSVLTFSCSDNTIGVWRLGRASVMCGQRYGVIDGRAIQARRNWSFPVDKPARHDEKVDHAKELLQKLSLTDYGGVFVHSKRHEHDNYQKLMKSVRNNYGVLTKKGRMRPKELRAQTAKMKNRKKANGLIKKMDTLVYRGKERSRTMGQMYGLTTWKTTTLEKSWQSALKQEIHDQEAKQAAESYKRAQALFRADKQTKELAEYTALLAPQDESASSGTLRQTVPTPWLPAGDKANWGINSTNRQKQMYTNMFKHLNRANEQQKRWKKVTLDEPVHFTASQFLEDQMVKLKEMKRLKKLRRRTKSEPAPEVKVEEEKEPEPKKEEEKKPLTEEEIIAAAMAEMERKFAQHEAAKSAEMSAAGLITEEKTTETQSRTAAPEENNAQVDAPAPAPDKTV